MKVELFPFQKNAVQKIRRAIEDSNNKYRQLRVPQVVSYTAPTGSGKTIIMASVIENIYEGDEYYPDKPDAIIVWLSDSPQLNEQSKLKIDTKADRIRIGQCITISDDSFDRETLEDGHIYFINTQKLSKTSNLTKHSDGRQYTIWETFSNTVRDKWDHLYFVIDEAHRGAKTDRELAGATTIMQKFLKGSEPDGLSPMPIVIGMTATSARFNRLAEGLQTTTVNYIRTTPDEVRASGLLKDRIIITYPETSGNDMAVLQAAADEWKNKWEHWAQYCFEQHYAYVNPILVVQVENGSAGRLSNTDLDECIRIIEERTGTKFLEGEVVHAFAEGTSDLQVYGMNVPYVEPSRIADDKRIKVVFFKETLSTGWDCPRAETMMSFRTARDYTFIAQLLGRMVRTPMQMHINVDESLNDVHLYLPHFDENTVYDVVQALKDTEGATIPTDIEAEIVGESNYVTLTVTPTYRVPRSTPAIPTLPGQTNIFDPGWNPITDQPSDVLSGNSNIPSVVQGPTSTAEPSEIPGISETEISSEPESNTVSEPTNPVEGSDIDREGIVRAINSSGLLTYDVRRVRITDYLKSMYALARLITQTRIDLDAKDKIISEIVEKIRTDIQLKKADGSYNDMANQIMQFKLNAQVIDVFGQNVDDYEIHDIYSTTDADIDRQFRNAEYRLGNEGVGNAYLQKYYDSDDLVTLKIDVIIFAADEPCMSELEQFAKVKFHELNDANRRRTVSLPDRFRKKYDDIVSDGDIVSKHNFKLPERIQIPRETDGKLYYNHLFVDDSGSCKIKLNSWEEKVIEEESSKGDFVCWIRNPSRGSWALCVPYETGTEKKPMYPDFMIIRKDSSEYIVDILEPHNQSMADNLGKAQGLAEYARENPGVGRIQLIRMKSDSLGNERPYRIDMSKSSVRDKVSRCMSNAELDHIFETDGFFM